MCKISWCNEKNVAKDLCKKHYYQMKRCGKIVGGTNDPLHYEIRGNIAIFKTHDKIKFIIDKEDINKISDIIWCENQNGYILANINGTTQLSRFLLDYKGDMHVDHINRNKLDNRKCNLRIISQTHNQWNKNCTNKNGANQVRYKENGWEVGITVNNKQIYLGRFKTKEEAVNTRLEAEKKYYKITTHN